MSAWLLRIFRWRVTHLPPPAPKGVVIIYPHTSNWDFILGVLARSVIQLRMHWVGKHSLFRWPFETIMRGLGGIPIDRSEPQGLVDQLKREFDRYAEIFIVLTPEGTRSHTTHWKSGFYHIALGLKVPLGLATFDYSKRQIILTDWFWLTGDVERDLAHLRDVYRDTHGKHPEFAGEIRFKDS